MKNTLEVQKEQLKEEMSKEIDRYYEELSTGLESRTMKIDDIERVLGETQTKIVELVTSAAGKAVSGTEQPPKKKDVLTVEGR